MQETRLDTLYAIRTVVDMDAFYFNVCDVN